MRAFLLISLIASLGVLNNTNTSSPWTDYKYYTHNAYQWIINTTLSFFDFWHVNTSPTIQDSEVIETKTMSISGINNINASRLGTVIVEQCSADEEMLTITADKNIMPHVNATITGKQLNLGIDSNLNIITTKPIIYHVKVKDLKAISASNNILVKTKNQFTTDSLTINLENTSTIDAQINIKNIFIANCSGSTNAQLQGSTKEQQITLKNRSNYQASNLQCATTYIQASNNSNAHIQSTELISYNLYNRASVTYTGNPKISGTTYNSATIKQQILCNIF